jgi:hypothetical protein
MDSNKDGLPYRGDKRCPCDEIKNKGQAMWPEKKEESTLAEIAERVRKNGIACTKRGEECATCCFLQLPRQHREGQGQEKIQAMQGEGENSYAHRQRRGEKQGLNESQCREAT